MKEESLEEAIQDLSDAGFPLENARLILQPSVAAKALEWLAWWDALPSWRRALYRIWWGIKEKFSND